jgi:hypothetical protein
MPRREKSSQTILTKKTVDHPCLRNNTPEKKDRLSITLPGKRQTRDIESAHRKKHFAGHQNLQQLKIDVGFF